MRTRLALVAALLVAAAGGLWAQQQSPAGGPIAATRLREAIDSYSAGDYSNAVVLLRGIVLDASVTTDKPDAYFWLAKSYLALDNLEDGGRALEYFLSTYPTHARYAEALYEKGRLLHRQDDNEGAIQVLQSFLTRFPESEFVANAYFWIGESLYALGQLDDALLVYRKVAEAYPSSFRVEAARYRAALIEFKKRENELLKLLKWSHEESLRTIEGFQRRETAYEQAIASYQRSLAAAQQSDLQQTLAEVNQTLAQREAELKTAAARLAEATAEIERLKAGAATAATTQTAGTEPATAGPAQDTQSTQSLQALLALKAEALALKASLLDWMARQQEGR